MVILRARNFLREGFAHGFSTRTGGASAPPYDSLNLASNVGDSASAVIANRALFARALGFEVGRLFEVSQVHGARVCVVEGSHDPTLLKTQQADALVTAAEGTALAVRTADCVPVLLADVRTRTVAAVHAGWRGVVAGVIAAALDAMQGLSATDPADVIAAIGPHIRAGCFEVGDEVADRFCETVTAAVVSRSPRGKARVDLAAAARHQLVALGVAEAAIEDVGGCTFAEASRFFSFRRDGARSGRHLSAVATGRPV